MIRTTQTKEEANFVIKNRQNTEANLQDSLINTTNHSCQINANNHAEIESKKDKIKIINEEITQHLKLSNDNLRGIHRPKDIIWEESHNMNNDIQAVRDDDITIENESNDYDPFRRIIIDNDNLSIRIRANMEATNTLRDNIEIDHATITTTNNEAK